ncbi:MAG: Omp28-related outer membrane protein [Saprospiraceae bacterium]|nr:Omp28-related outer membrane protein [Saprospiraceae bacterium]
MKPIVSICLLLVCAFGFAQSPRKVLYEHFTQASCPPCATVNPVLHPILERNSDKLVRVTHQVSWPGYDPMNKDNPGEIQSRVTYYGISGVPGSRMNGALARVTPTIEVNDAMIEAAASLGSPYEISIGTQLNPNLTELDVKVDVKLTGNLIGRPILRLVVMEKIIRFAQPPGTNGEREFHHVIKKFLPNTGGTSLSNLSTTGETQSFEFNYKFDKLYDFKNLEVAAFIQNETTKEVLQAENATPEFPKTAAADLIFRTGTPGQDPTSNVICGTSTTPRISFLNQGETTLQSAKFEYSINGGVSASHGWTGQLNYLQEAIVNLPSVEVPYLKSTDNTIELRLIEQNGVQLQEPKTFHINFEPPPVTSTKCRIEIKPISKPDLIVFDVTDGSGNVILRGGPFADNTVKVFDLELQENTCYKLNVNNRHTSVNGTARLFNENNELIVNTSLTSQRLFVSPFTTYQLVASENLLGDHQGILVFPNPVNDLLNIHWNVRENGPAVLSVFDLSGKQVFSKKLHTHYGINQHEILSSEWSEGSYLIQIKTLQNTLYSKFAIAR